MSAIYDSILSYLAMFASIPSQIYSVCYAIFSALFSEQAPGTNAQQPQPLDAARLTNITIPADIQGHSLHTPMYQQARSSHSTASRALTASTPPSVSFAQVEMVGQKVPISNLIERYTTKHKAHSQLTDIARTYPIYQPMAPDGNCFYTAFSVDFILNFTRLSSREKSEKIELFLDCSASREAKEAVVSALNSLSCGTPFPLSNSQLMRQFVKCLRAIGVDFIQNHRGLIFPSDIPEDFVEQTKREMRQMGAYAEQPMMVALQKSLNHPIRILPANGLEFEISRSIPEDAFPGAIEPPRCFLYTNNNHYDLVHKN